MGTLKECEDLFGCSSLYELLQLDKDATESAIKRAYRRMSLKVHPDRASSEEKETSTKKFQLLTKVCAVLLDEDLRKIYDETGEIDDQCTLLTDGVSDWKDYWKNKFHLDIEDVKKFEESYRGSPEEAEDLKENYVDSKGDMDLIFEKQMCSTVKDETRFRKILKDAISSNEIPSFDAFVNESKAKKKRRQKFFQNEAKEAAKARKENGLGDEDDEDQLKMLILGRQENRKQEMDSFIKGLEEKYCNPNASKKRKKK